MGLRCQICTLGVEDGVQVLQKKVMDEDSDSEKTIDICEFCWNKFLNPERTKQ